MFQLRRDNTPERHGLKLSRFPDAHNIRHARGFRVTLVSLTGEELTKPTERTINRSEYSPQDLNPEMKTPTTLTVCKCAVAA